MKNIAALTSSMITGNNSSFKLQLRLLEEHWSKGRFIKEFYCADVGTVYGHIFTLDNEEFISTINLYFGDNANTTEVCNFLDETFSERNLNRFCKNFVSVSLQSPHFDLIFKVIETKLGKKYKEENSIFAHKMFKAPLTVPEKIPVPQGYILGPLQLSCVESIVQQWAKDLELNTSDDTPVNILRSTVVANIQERPGIGLYKEGESGLPVAWITMYSGGELGMLHVVKEHRRRKLARILLREMLRVVREALGQDSRTHCFVKLHNTDCQRLLHSEGWVEQQYNNKRMFFHTDYLSKLNNL